MKTLLICTTLVFVLFSGAIVNAATISGKIFEDVNFGGSAGRNQAASGGIGLSGVRVELYSATGSYLSFTTTVFDGSYSFTVANDSYLVRPVLSSVRSSRSGSIAGLLPVQTYRYESSWVAAAAVTNEVGGARPDVADSGNAIALSWNQCATENGGSSNPCSFTGTRVVRFGAGTNWTTRIATDGIACSTVVFGDPDVGTPKTCEILQPNLHSASSASTMSGNATGVDFGYNFDTITNTNDSGQGSLRQFITNANTLGGDASLVQSGLVAAKENAVFMISNGTAATGLRASNNYFSGGAATITPASDLPNISTPMVIDAQKQPGWSGSPVVVLNGGSYGANGTGLTIVFGSGGSAVRGLNIQNFTAAGINISASSGNTIAGNWIGLNTTGTAAAGNRLGINIWQSGNNIIGGTTASDRNVISASYNAQAINISDPASSGNQIRGNYIGTNAAGTAAVGNQWQGIYLDSPNNTVGGPDSSYRNIISGTIAGPGILLTSAASGSVITSNYIGLNAAGTAALGNGGEGISVSSANNTIGGNSAALRNIISGNSGAGVYLHGTSATGNSIKGNYIGTDASGSASLGNGIVNVVEGVGADGSSNNTIGGTGAGDGNRIWFNGTAGVAIQSVLGSATGNAILGNSISGNVATIGIDLSPWGVTVNDGTKSAGQPNLLMDFPVFTSASLNGTSLTVSGYVGSAANQATFANARVEVFKSDNDTSGYGEGQTYLGFLTTNASGNFSGSLDVTGKGLNAGDRITGTATDAGNNTSEFGANVAVIGYADLSLSLVDNPDPAAVGGELLYTMLITNNGPNTANNVVLTNTLPAGVTLVSATPSQGSCSGTTTVTCNLGAMLNTGTTSIEILVVTSAAGTITDSASITATETDSVPANNAATVTTQVVAGITTRIPLTQFRRIHGFVDSTVTGGSLRTGVNGSAACNVVASSSAALSGIPASATVVNAYLYWAGSGSTIDSQVTLDGGSLTADRTFTARYVLPPTNYDYFGGFKDVTAQVQAKRNGTYTFSGLAVDTANPYCSSQAVLAGWSLIVIYSDSTSVSGKTIVLYDGFDIRRNDSTSYNLTGIFAATPPEAKATFLVWEGDDDLKGSGESLLFNGSTLSDAYNPVSNVYNSTINTLGVTTSYGLDLDTFDVTSHVNARDTLATTTVSVGPDLVLLNAVLLQVKSNIITGKVFEDVNYGGGAGRDLASAAAAAPGFSVARPGAIIELYDTTGTMIRSTTTDNNGEYGFAGLADGDYTVRVVNGSVTSSRPGSTAGERAIQTFRTDAGSATAVAVTDEVGGANPNLQDSPANATNANLAAIVAQSKAPAKIVTGIAVTGVDFGFNFDTIVNTNDSGQGSLRQFLANANILGNNGLSQSGRGASIDNALFMISNGTAAAGLRAANNYFSSGLATIGLTSALPTISDPVVIDGSTQPGWTGPQIIKLNGAGAGGGANGLTLSGGNSTIRELIIDGFGGAGLSISGTGGSIVSDNIVHANNRGIYDNAASDQFFRNLIYVNSGANGEGIYLDSGASGVKIYQNTIHGNSTRGISQAGGSATVRNNLITGSGGAGLYSSGGP